MITSGSVEIGSDDLAGAFQSVRSVRVSVEALRTALVAAIVSAALLVRLFGLGASGFTEDEVNKLHAIQAYRHGEFSANAEHPMLMKLAMWGSIVAAERWN